MRHGVVMTKPGDPPPKLTWRDTAKVDEYVARVGRLAARAAGEAELVEALPVKVERVLDLAVATVASSRWCSTHDRPRSPR
jgi:hypothetical protein